MVRSRLVDLPDSPEREPPRSIPDMMFAVGEEPVGVRVLTYLSSGAITRIYNALEEEEVQQIRQSTFGKILDLVDKPVYSGRFARYILSRQLKTKKKHEIWFRFAGKPIRFSLREFAIVTGLPCGHFPVKSKMKLKNSLSEKPYWPSLFGKIEVVTVASVLKMLRKRTVQEKVVRIKYACLAILASVLLPTNINMKISREHVDAIEDLDSFFSFPWGRLAFDMLMSSIKEKDEIALSQNTFAVKGFVLALQLVIVEAVPCLYEVVQEMCSSSEGESEDDEADKSARAKRRTLSPAHARHVDKRTDVLVRSIIAEDPLRPIDETQLMYPDEAADEKVDNLLFLINTQYDFPRSIFVGGVTRLDIERLREAGKVCSKAKKPKLKLASSTPNDSGSVASLVTQKFKQEIQTMKGTLFDTCKRVDSVEGSLAGIVESLFDNFREEVLESVKNLVSEMIKAEQVGRVAGENNVTNTTTIVTETLARYAANRGLDANAEALRNVIANLSQYSTPPASPRLSQGENVSTGCDKASAKGEAVGDEARDPVTQSANSHNYQRSLDLNHPMEVGDMGEAPGIDMPSFSLGLTQEDLVHNRPGNMPHQCGGRVSVTTVSGGSKCDDPQSSRRSKRKKCVPHSLLDDYQCGRDMVLRQRKSQKFVFAFYEVDEINRKYSSVVEEVKREGVFKFAGIVVSEKDILQIAERTSHFTARVMDLLIQLVRSSVEENFHSDFSQRDVYLDSKYINAMSRMYPRFCKMRKKESFRFTQCVVNLFHSTKEVDLEPRRYYFPVNVCKRHWVGVCVDPTCGKIIVLDSNTALFSDATIEKQLNPHFAMLPHILRKSNEASMCGPHRSFSLDRPKGLFQSEEPIHSGLLAVLFMASHAVYGIEACKHIHATMLDEEGKSAVILAHELRESV